MRANFSYYFLYASKHGYYVSISLTAGMCLEITADFVLLLHIFACCSSVEQVWIRIVITWGSTGTEPRYWTGMSASNFTWCVPLEIVSPRFQIFKFLPGLWSSRDKIMSPFVPHLVGECYSLLSNPSYGAPLKVASHPSAEWVHQRTAIISIW